MTYYINSTVNRKQHHTLNNIISKAITHRKKHNIKLKLIAAALLILIIISI